MKRDLISFALWTADELQTVLKISRVLATDAGHTRQPLAHKTAAMIFECASLRTRVSFEVGIAQLGGHPVFLDDTTIRMAARESVHDIGSIVSQYTDLIIARTVRHQACVQLAESATVPVINALTDLLHPCQVLGDVYTLIERKRFTPSTKIVYLGDGNAMANSWLECAARLPFHLVCSCPAGYEPHPRFLEEAQNAGVSSVEMVHDPVEAVRDADVIYTDVWPQATPRVEEGRRALIFRPYQVNKALLKHAKPDCLVMHRLPANRGEEITGEVLDGPQSIAVEQARNRLTVQNGIMAALLEGAVR
jgi:ornithine carbamoyltransferase